MRGVDVLDGDSYVVDPAEHGRQSTRRAAARRRRRRVLDPEDLGQRRQARPRAARASAPVATSRWISWPGAWNARARAASWWRSLQANISTAIEAPPRPTPARATGPGRSTSRSRSTVPPAESSIIGTIRLEPQRSCSLGTVGDVLDPLLVGGDRLVLDPVVGGEVAVHQRHHRRHRADRLHQALAQRRGSAIRLRSAAVAARVVPTAATTRQSSKGSRAAGSRRRASGSTAIASASFSGPAPPAPARRASAPAWASAPRRPGSPRRCRGPPPPSASGRGSAGRCEGPSRRVEGAGRGSPISP